MNNEEKPHTAHTIGIASGGADDIGDDVGACLPHQSNMASASTQRRRRRKECQQINNRESIEESGTFRALHRAPAAAKQSETAAEPQ